MRSEENNSINSFFSLLAIMYFSIGGKQMSYQKNRTPNYSMPRRVQAVQAGRSLRAKRMNLAKKAKLAPLEKWEKQPNRYDLVYSVDYPAGKKPKDGEIQKLGKPEPEKEEKKEESKEAKPKEEPEKTEAARSKAPKIPKKPKPKPPGMTAIERMHLLAACKQFSVDTQEIDSNVSYGENKKHVQEMAKMKGFSRSEIAGLETEQKEWTQGYENYLNSLKGELEGAGYVIREPSM